MATYHYVNEDGDRQVVQARMGEATEHMFINGKPAWRDFAAEHCGPIVPTGKGWPIECIASGVNAADADELRKVLADKGVPTEVSSDGNPIYRDASHRRRALKARGFFDRSSF